MKVLGIIVEYNPFHNGHIYHINKAKELIHPDYTIAVMSSSFVQRGEAAIISKFDRANIAIEYGVDLVIELPFVYAVESADYFSKGAIELLAHIGCTDLVFGSECCDIDTFIEIANVTNNNNTYDSLVKEYMQQGLRYADATNKALATILNKEVKTPNDLLGLAYVKEIIHNNYHIMPHCIKRTNDYHSTYLESISSATALRTALKEGKDVNNYLPHIELYKNIYHTEDLFPYLQYILKTTSKDELASYHMVEEGIENKLLSINSNNYEELVEACLSKRYTRPRIQRMLLHILMKNTKEDIQTAYHLDYIRILKMNELGREYLNKIKKECDYKIITNFSSYHCATLDMEYKATKLLSLLDASVLDRELKEIPLIKEDASL